jgi:transposase
MGKPLADDLRRKLLSAYDQGEGSLPTLAIRFLVSEGWAKKISAARNHTGQAERVPHIPGRKPRVGAEQQKLVIAWVASQPDLTLVEIQAKLKTEAGITLGVPRVWRLLKKLNLRLKKSRSTPLNATLKPTKNDVRSLLRKSARSSRNA